MENHFECLWDLYRSIPSLKNPGQSVLDEFYYLNMDDPSSSPVRVTFEQGKDAHTLHKFTLSDAAVLEMSKLVMTPERDLQDKKITDVFSKDFFESNFWLFWRSMFAFEDWHSAIEMRRYVTRFIHHTHNLTDLSCLKFTSYNQYESLIQPLISYLMEHHVRFEYDTVVNNVVFRRDNGKQIASQIVITQSGEQKVICPDERDLVLVTLGSNTENSFGNPKKFYGDIAGSNWESATITCIDEKIPAYIAKLTGRNPYNGKIVTGGPITAKDSSWLMSWTVSRQPHFAVQKPNEIVAWVYGLFSDEPGDYIKKPMKECTGEEITMEWLYHIGVPVTEIEELAKNHAVSIPCMMPYVTSYFMARKDGDRPLVVPECAQNLAFIGEFVETPADCVFTTEYAVRTGMEAVYTLLELDRGVPEVFASAYDVRVLLQATAALLDGRKLTDVKLPVIQKFALSKGMKIMSGTVVEDMLKENHLI